MNDIYIISYCILKFFIYFLLSIVFLMTGELSNVFQLIMVILYILYCTIPKFMIENIIMDCSFEYITDRKLFIIIGNIVSFLFSTILLYILTIGLYEVSIYVLIVDIIVFMLFGSDLTNLIACRKCSVK